MARRNEHRFRLPTWFRAVVSGGFGLLLLGFFLVRDQGEARALALLESAAAPLMPFVETNAALHQARQMPPSGRYRLNGMRVKYDSFVPQGATGRTLVELEGQMEAAGYMHRIFLRNGVPTLIGVHPTTRVMLSVLPGTDRRGRGVVRITEYQLADLDGGRAPEVDLPIFPGAGEPLVIEYEGDPPTRSLTYSVGAVPHDVAAFYARQMPHSGWRYAGQPAGLPGAFSATFFQRQGAECAVAAVELPNSSHVLVVVTETTTGGAKDV